MVALLSLVIALHTVLMIETSEDVAENELFQAVCVCMYVCGPALLLGGSHVWTYSMSKSLCACSAVNIWNFLRKSYILEEVQCLHGSCLSRYGHDEPFRFS